MYISPNLPKISKEAMFALLQNRYRKTYANVQQGEECRNVLIFRETFDVIRCYESLLLRAKSGKNDTRQTYKKITPISKKSFLNYMCSLVYRSNFFPEWSGLEIPIFRKTIHCLKEIEIQNEHNKQINIARIFNNYFRDIKFCVDQESSLSSINIEEITTNYLTISEKIEYALKDDEDIKETFILSDEEEKYFNYFNKTLEQNGQVYILCLDIKFYAPIKDYQNSYSRLFIELKDKINAARQLILQIENLKSCLLKLEPMQEIGLNLHCILMFSCKISHVSEDGIISQLDKKLKKLSLAGYVIKNWNDHLRSYHEANAVGLIKKNNLQKRYHCWEWVYSYFFTVNQVIELNIEDFDSDDIVFFDASPDVYSPLLVKKLLQKNEKKEISFDEILLPSKKKFDCQHLPKIAQDYLEKVELFDFPFNLTSIGNDYKNQGNSLLYLIEIFCETLKVVPPKLFNIVAVEFISSNSQSPKFYRNKLTRLGHIWFSLLKKVGSEDFPFFEIYFSNFKSKNLIDFFNFFLNKQRLLELYHQPINFEIIQKHEEILKLFKANLNVNSYVKQLKDLDNSFQKLLDYSKFLLEKDVLVYRLYLKFDSLHDGNLGKKEQSIILTEFLRVGRSTQPMRWLRGYILRWDEEILKSGQKGLYADLTLFFDYDSKIQDLDVYKKLKEFLNSFVNKQNQKYRNFDASFSRGGLDGIKTEINFCIEQKHVLYEVIELSSTSLKIETTDKMIRKAFTERYLPYICYMSLFSSVENWIWKGKRITSGQRPKPKQGSIKKNLISSHD
ncbi:hypothetical protein [Acinetobacter sp. ANC 3791]|uniref:hypothetical protein n=1 Tax=Acinetobacter sp. ANC 3791 TaxID=2529836 RepID=UPI00103D8C4E|nr:hypothetical protein [Acinetobacter sp. ANC 3791]TCB83906.1 hypothetical protein E0H90_10020 [Acinetobacter sp. ANC 3791]